MAGVDSLLRMMLNHGADELRLGTDLPPKMLKRGAPLRLSIPPTDDAMLQHLLDGVVSADQHASLRADGKLELSYKPDSGEPYAVSLQARGPAALDAIFRRAAAPRPAAPPPPPPRAAAPPPVQAPPPPVQAPPPLSTADSTLFERAVALRASDIHLLAGEVPSLRIDGRLRPLEDFPAAAVNQLLEECARDLGAGVSLDRALQIDGLGRFRLNLYRTQGRLAAAIRVLLRQAPSLEELHFPVSLSELVQSPHGLVLVTGSTGSGKSATLAALAQEALRLRGGVLITLEDPIEYAIEAASGGLVRQREVGRDVRDFTTGLRDALREDPDILLIGEMRDAESISLALTAAETGHLVLASLHSRSAASSVERIVDSYPPERQHQIRVQLADALRAVVAQRLLPRARGQGRLPALEILRGNQNVGSLIREGKTAQIPNTLASSRKEGMFTLERCLADLVRSGQITREAALLVANDVPTLTSYLSSGA